MLLLYILAAIGGACVLCGLIYVLLMLWHVRDELREWRKSQ